MRDNVNLFGNTSEPIGSAVFLDVAQGTAAALATFTLPDDVNGDIDFELVGLSSETVGVTISDDGTNYSAALKPFDIANGVIVSAATLAAGRFRLRIQDFGTPKYVKFTKSSTSETCAVGLAAPRPSIKF